MINLRVLVPESTTNYIKNPNFRYDTTDWTAFGSTLTRTLDYARFGIASGKVVTNGSVANEGVYYRVNALSGISGPVSVSVYVRGVGEDVRLRLRDGVTGKVWYSQPVTLTIEYWQRIEVSGVVTGSDDVRLYVETADKVARAITFYVDGAQMETKAYATSYCDGDQPGCTWAGTYAGSTSSRSADTREGGRWVALAGPCRPDNDIYVTTLGGLGMPPVSNAIQSWASEPGAFYQSTKIESRVMVFNFYVKHKETLSFKPPAPTVLHALRKQLIDLFKPDKTIGGEAFWFEYSDTTGEKPLYIKMRYEGGMEGSWDIRNGFYDSFPIRLLAVEPLWKEDSQDVMQLRTEQTYPTSSHPLWKKDINNKWQKINIGISLNVDASAIGPDGALYIGGADGTTNKVYKWDGNNLTLIATSVLPFSSGNAIRDMVFGKDGILYMVGTFSSVHGVSANGIATYNPATGTWGTLSTGANIPPVQSVCAADNGQIYFGGAFTALGGVTCQSIGRWDGSQFRTVGKNSGLNQNNVKDIKKFDENTLVLCGTFTDDYGEEGGDLKYVCFLDTTTNLFSPVGTGIAESDVAVASGASAIAVGLDKSIYLSYYVSTTLFGKVMVFFGGTWSYLATLNAPAVVMEAAPNGEIYLGGNFTSSTEYGAMNRFAFIKGNVINSVPAILVAPTGSSYIENILFNNQGEMIIGGVTSENFSAITPYYNSIENNGNAGVYPILYVKGQGALRYLENTKTKQALYLNLVISSNEEIEINFAKGTIVSTTRGSILHTILSGSEIRGFFLLSGLNEFAVYMDNEITPTCQLRWRPQHWSADSIMTPEDL